MTREVNRAPTWSTRGVTLAPARTGGKSGHRTRGPGKTPVVFGSPASGSTPSVAYPGSPVQFNVGARFGAGPGARTRSPKSARGAGRGPNRRGHVERLPPSASPTWGNAPSANRRRVPGARGSVTFTRARGTDSSKNRWGADWDEVTPTPVRHAGIAGSPVQGPHADTGVQPPAAPSYWRRAPPVVFTTNTSSPPGVAIPFASVSNPTATPSVGSSVKSRMASTARNSVVALVEAVRKPGTRLPAGRSNAAVVRRPRRDSPTRPTPSPGGAPGIHRRTKPR